MILIGVYLLIFTSIVIFILGIQKRPSVKIQGLEESLLFSNYKLTNEPKKAKNFFLLPYVNKILEKLRLEEKIKEKIEKTNLKISPLHLFNLKLFFILIAVALSFVLGAVRNPVILIIFAGFGYIIPDIYLRRKEAERKNTISKLLPETVDLLALCVEAGLDFTTALRWIIEKTTPNPLTEEFVILLEEIRWGKSRAQALKDMAKRLNIPEITSFVRMLLQAERVGVPIGEALGIISEDTRLYWFHRGERYAMKAPIKILIPLIFCILPTIAIIVGGPIILQFVQGGFLKSFSF